MGCAFNFSEDTVEAVYLYDEKEIAKINRFKDDYLEWIVSKNPDKDENKPKLKAYSEMFIKDNGISDFQKDIERIVDLTDIKLNVETGMTAHIKNEKQSYLSDSRFINLYNFALILNGRWNLADEWKQSRENGWEDKFIANKDAKSEFEKSFKELSLEYKLSNINQAKAFAKYMHEIGCFYTDKSVDFELVEGFTEEDLLKIGLLEHHRWLQEHADMGWVYGTPEKAERDLLRHHKDMIPGYNPKIQPDISIEQAKENYKRLDQAEQDKDTEPMECMLAMMKMFDGLRIYRLN
jgi:hypothetical protein